MKARATLQFRPRRDLGRTLCRLIRRRITTSAALSREIARLEAELSCLRELAAVRIEFPEPSIQQAPRARILPARPSAIVQPAIAGVPATELVKIAERIAWKSNAKAIRGIDTDDLRQEACLAALEAASRFDPSRASAKTFLFNRMRFAMLDVARKGYFLQGGRGRGRTEKRQPLTDELGRDQFPEPREPEAAAAQRRSEDADHFKAWAHRFFRPRTAEMLILRFVEDLSMAEIGKRVGVSESRVSQMMTDVLAQARSMMEGRKC